MTIRVRVGQQDAVRVISSTAVNIPKMEDIADVNISSRQPNKLMMYNGTSYVHVDPKTILDLSDGTLDNVVDYGSF